MDPTRNLNAEFADESNMQADGRSASGLQNATGGNEVPLRAEGVRTIPVPEQMWAMIQTMLAQAAATPNAGVPPVTPTGMLGLMSQFGLMGNINTPMCVQPQNTPPAVGVKQPVVPQVLPEGGTSDKKKKAVVVAHSQTDSSEDVESIEAEPRPDPVKAKELAIRQQIQELSEALERTKDMAREAQEVNRSENRRKRVAIRSEPEGERSEIRRKKQQYADEKPQDSKLGSWRVSRMRRSPFCQAILEDPLPSNYKAVAIEYDGTQDPNVHMSRFEALVALHQYSEGIKCRVFTTTLVGVAQKWFQKLEEGSINDFEELHDAFMHQFASSCRVGPNALSLLDMKQGESESLRDFVSRFNITTLEIPDAEERLKIFSFTKALRGGPLFDSLQICPPTTFGELLSRVPGYIQLEEARAARRAEAEKNKPKKEKAENSAARYPPRGPQPRGNENQGPQWRNAPAAPGHQRGGVSGQRPDEYKPYTPLNRSINTIFNSLCTEPFFAWPAYSGGPPLPPSRGRELCRYHNAYGHLTENCRHLKDTIETLAQEGRIPGFVQRTGEQPREQPREVQYVHNRSNQIVRRNPNQANNQPPPPPPLPNREVRMIIDGAVDGSSNRARKQIIRDVRSGRFEVMRAEVDEDSRVEIAFGPRDYRQMQTPHSDALVCTAEIASCLVHRMFVDTGSAVNILYSQCLQAMGIEAQLKPAESPLYGFSGESILPLGTIELPVTLGSPAARKTRMVEFTIMDYPNASYNGILGRPALVAFKAVISMTHLTMKFPVGGEVGVVFGSQLSAKECYVKAVSERGGGKRPPAPKSAEGRTRKTRRAEQPNRSEALTITEEQSSEDSQPQLTTGDECMKIELYPGKEGFTTNMGAGLAPAVREQLTECLRKNVDIFAFSTSQLKGISRSIAEHRLNEDPKAKPVRQRIRHFGEEKDKAIREQVTDLLKAGHIEEVKYPIWISNAVMVAKKDKKWRMCIDFRDLNAACPKDYYPLPRIDQLVDSTAGYQLLSMMDAFQGYHQIKMHREDVPKTAFAVCCGVFGYVSMPFGLKNAGATYQRMMDFVFREQIGKNVAVYVDDMLVKSVSATDHVADLDEVFRVIREHGLMLNPAKCNFGVQSGRFLGYEITPRGIEVNKEKVKAILEMQAPRNTNEVQKLNGRITALSRFISRLADKSLPFCKILRNAAKFSWSEEAQTAFDALKKFLADLPVLSKPAPAECLFLYLAVGEESLSTVLVREEKEQHLPIYFTSRILKPAEQRYSEMEKAALAVMVTARKLRPYFLSHRVVVKTALPFKQTLGRPDLSGRMVKWAIELGEYEIDFEPRRAIKAQALADFIQETTRTSISPEWNAWTDGSVTKEGCGLGVFLRSPQNDDLQFAVKMEEMLSNNEAEYEAVARALEMLKKVGAERVIIHTDSQLVAQQVMGNYEVKESRMNQYVQKIRALAAELNNFEIIQIPREENSKADMLARMASATDCSWAGDISFSFVPRPRAEEAEVFAIRDGETDWRAPIIHYLKTGQRMNGKPVSRAIHGRFCLIDGRLFRRSFSIPLLKCIVGEEAAFALKEIHEGCCGSHAGYKDLMKKVVRAGFYWPDLGLDAKEYVRKCQKCQKNAPRIHVPAEEMGAMFSAHPFDKWGIDIVGKLPTARGGKCFLIVAVDYFSKWVEAEAVAKIDEVAVERFLWRNICCRYGVPRILISDNGTQFTGARIQDFCDRMDITQRFVSVAHPQANGQVEMTNRVICDGLQKRLEKSKGKWADELDSVLWAHRTSPKTATGETPFNLVFGSEAVIPAELRLESLRVEQYDEKQNEARRREELDLVDCEREMAAVRAAKYKSLVKANYDRKVRVRRFNRGDLVLKRADALRQTGKFEQNWEGPFIVTEVLKGGAYHLADTEGRSLPRPWNINCLKKFYV